MSNFIWIIIYFLPIIGNVINKEFFQSSLRAIVKDQNIKLIMLQKEIWIPFIYAFHGDNCIQIFDDDSSFSDILIRAIHNVKDAPAIIYGLSTLDPYCHSHLILVNNVQNLPSVVSELRRWAADRIMCLIYQVEQTELKLFLATSTRYFGDAEVLIVTSQNLTAGFRMEQPIRIFNEVTLNKDTWERNYDGIHEFEKREITVSTKNFSIYTKIALFNELGQPPKLEGVELNIFKEILKRMNLTYKVVLSSNGIGTKLNGQWVTGILGDVAKKKVDIGIRGLWISSDKVNSGIVMSAPIRSIRLIYVIPRPAPLLGTWYGVFQPFQKYMWILIGIALVLYSLSLSGISLLIKCLFKNSKVVPGSETLKNSFFHAYGILFFGSWPKINQYFSPIRHLFLWWSIFALLISTSFSSSLVSKLTTPIFHKPINTIEEFIEKGYCWTLREKITLDTMFDIKDPIHKKWIEEIKFMNKTEEYNKILATKNNQVILGYEINNSFHLFDEEINDTILKRFETTHDYLMEFHLAFAFREGSVFNQGINRYIRYFRESGLIEYIINMEIRKKAIVNPYIYSVRKHERHNIHKVQRKLSMNDLKGIFLVLSVGLTVATIVALLEWLYL